MGRCPTHHASINSSLVQHVGVGVVADFSQDHVPWD